MLSGVCVSTLLKDRPELTPVAIRAGKLLARRMFNDSKVHMDYHMVRLLQLVNAYFILLTFLLLELFETTPWNLRTCLFAFC